MKAIQTTTQESNAVNSSMMLGVLHFVRENIALGCENVMMELRKNDEALYVDQCMRQLLEVVESWVTVMLWDRYGSSDLVYGQNRHAPWFDVCDQSSDAALEIAHLDVHGQLRKGNFAPEIDASCSVLIDNDGFSLN